ncbi:hypothetical protein SAMN02745163_03316 [Clostridium cavendishii DSM 21758]|uniref:Dockerin domain-containing protein n=1 Tax=Clostridium cavendishii DSM 21758 TaxID=1121302 RepID=A0A1M6Q898_9CLOT|nr:dockerin type I domain-containing protein [Clostridium cavendishii]SHK16370.1 hypothetical protein SAMN02745163_03316 [Clostridium cavendishii DSM 21758]
MKKKGLFILVFLIIFNIDIIRVFGVEIKGDFNNDGNIDEKDLQIITNNYMSNNPIYDMNNDGQIDIYDMVIVSKMINNSYYKIYNNNGVFIKGFWKEQFDEAIKIARENDYFIMVNNNVYWNNDKYWVYDGTELKGNYNAMYDAVKNASNFKNGVVLNKLGQRVLDNSKGYKAKIAVTQDELNLRNVPAWSPKTDINIPNKELVEINKIDKGFFGVYWNKDSKNILQGYVPYYLDIIQDDNENTMLGYISGREESGLNVGAISDNPNDKGGVSCGVWQFSGNMGSLGDFITYLRDKNYDFYNRLTNAKNSDGGQYKENFKTEWKNIAENYSYDFYKLQQKYSEENFYKNCLNQCNAKGYNLGKILNYSSTRNMIWSTAIHHGQAGAARIFSSIDSNLPVEDYIRTVYAKRLEIIAASYPPNSSNQGVVDIYNSIKKRFERECNEIIRCYQREISY